MSLNFVEHPARDAKAQKLVVLLHGYGADGEDLIGLAPSWDTSLPKVDFVSPHAPFPCEGSPFGRQWFSLENRDLRLLEEGLRHVLPTLNAFLDALLAGRGLTDQDMCLVGFSQGTMMALACALSRPTPCAGVLGYSGALLFTPAPVKDPPPIYLIHGEEDPVVPFQAMADAQERLQRHGLSAHTEARPGLAHGIDEEGLRLGGLFLKKCLQI